MPPTPRDTLSARWIAPVMLLLGSTCFVLVWTLLAIYLESQSSWMAVVAAVDSALLLRLGGMRPGIGRAALAVGATVAIILVFNWAMVATQIGMVMGLNPLDSALKLGMHHAQILADLANNGADLAWMALALVVAWWMAR
jgi:uncharacterized membrane protein